MSRDNLLLLTELVRMAAEKEPQNAYWRQCEAVFQYTLQNQDAVEKAWHRASSRTNWNDYQSIRIQKFLDRMAHESGAEMAWHPAVAYQLTSTDTPRMIYSLGSSLIDESSTLDTRWATFENGLLLRDGSKNRQAAKYGHNLMEIAATGSKNSILKRREVTATKMQFPLDLLKQRSDTDSQIAVRGLKVNEAYSALVFSPTSAANLAKLTGQAALSASLPGSLALTGTIAGLLLGTLILFRTEQPSKPWPIAVPLTLAFGIGLATYFLTKLLLPAFWVFLVLALFALRPPIALQSTPPKATLSIKLLCFSFGVLTAAIVCAGATASSTPFQSLISALPSGWWSDIQSTIFYSLLVLIGMYLFLAQVIAYRLRRSAGKFILHISKTTLAVAALGCFFCSVILTPVCIMWDHKIHTELRMISLNETAYYLNR
ncbi:MAG: hypothetical protein KF824_03295 [Fimbriimonadaceae bacterium]|nr:MAG: hypothetical protein KF824_03295 [Fimbriimonadaceae bacterium]